jgi:hypothetical protein
MEHQLDQLLGEGSGQRCHARHADVELIWKGKYDAAGQRRLPVVPRSITLVVAEVHPQGRRRARRG